VDSRLEGTTRVAAERREETYEAIKRRVKSNRDMLLASLM